MKKNEILKVLKDNKKISAYELIINDKDSRELFYVLDHLEISRAVKTKNVSIRIYVSDKKTTGSSLVKLTAADDINSLKTKINKAIVQAKSARNPYYPLAEKKNNINSTLNKEYKLNDIALNVAKAIFKADHYRNGWINSTEIFVSKFKEEFINSNGINHINESFKIEVECIPTWSNTKEEFELYKFLTVNKIDYKAITREIEEILQLAKLRSEAKTIKQVKLPKDITVLVKNDMLETLVDNFAYDLSYRNVYMKSNHYEIKDVLSNNKFDLTMKASANGCASSRKFDNHGVALSKKTLIKDGIVKNNHGDIQFGYYLKSKDITGNLPIIEIKADGINYKKEKHLIIETFSSPQLEESSGYWGGEVRLARYFDGKKYIPLTGFSISGNIYKDIKDVKFSKEETAMSNYSGPKYMIFKGIKIS